MTSFECGVCHRRLFATSILTNIAEIEYSTGLITQHRYACKTCSAGISQRNELYYHLHSYFAIHANKLLTMRKEYMSNKG